MKPVRVIGVAAVGVAFVRSPRYLAEKIADAVDDRAPEVRNESHFWRNVLRVYDLFPSELPALQARIAAKYCRNLDIWKELDSLRRDRRIFLLYSGPELILDCWLGEYRLEQEFDGIVRGASHGLTARDPAYYRLFAEQCACEIGELLVVESSGPAFATACDAGARGYRYGTGYGLQRHLDCIRGAGVSPLTQ